MREFLGEADTRANLIDPALRKCGWTEDLVRREVSGGTDELENKLIFRTSEVATSGGLAALQQAGDSAGLLRETKQRMFAA